MYTESIIVRNAQGLHARPASKLVELASEYASDIKVECKDKVINAKSILSVLAGGVYAGSEIVLKIEGADEQVAAPVLSNFLNNLPD